MSNEITLAAGEETTLSLHGFGFYVVKSDGAVIVELREIDSSVDEAGVLLAGQGLQGSNRFESVRIINMHSATQTIEFYVGPRTFVDNRNVGEVTVNGTVAVDPVPSETYPDFVIGKSLPVATGKYGYLVLVNPLASGKRLLVREVSGALQDGGVLKFAQTSNLSNLTLVGGGVDKGGHGVASVGQLYERETSSQHASLDDFNVIRIKADTGDGKEFYRPFVLNEGEAMVVYASGTANNTAANFEWEERPNV